MYPQISLALTLHHLHQRKFSVQQTETKQKITSIKLQNYRAQSQWMYLQNTHSPKAQGTLESLDRKIVRGKRIREFAVRSSDSNLRSYIKISHQHFFSNLRSKLFWKIILKFLFLIITLAIPFVQRLKLLLWLVLTISMLSLPCVYHLFTFHHLQMCSAELHLIKLCITFIFVKELIVKELLS